MSKELERAWAAGFFDGEGCFTISMSRSGRHHKYDNIQAQVTIGQKSLDGNPPRVLLRFRDAVGVGVVRSDAHHSSSGMWKWYVGQWDKVQHVVRALWPYLGEVKKEQALRQAVRYWDHQEQIATRKEARLMRGWNANHPQAKKEVVCA